jgi:hypothetical protein
MKRHDKAPNGHFAEGLILYGNLETGAMASQGILIEPPDLQHASIGLQNDFQDKLRIFLATLSSTQRVQLQWTCNSDYKKELIRYHEQTAKAEDDYVRSVRQERFARYWQRMVDRTLRREQLVLFISQDVEISANMVQSKVGLLDYYYKTLHQLRSHFNELGTTLTTIFGAGTTVRPMSDLEHFSYYKKFLNPSLADRIEVDFESLYREELSIQELCWDSDGVGLEDRAGFYLDGHYHSLFTIKRWPQKTYPGIVHRLTSLPFLDYQITVNLEPIPVRDEITREEKAIDRLRGDYESEGKFSLSIALKKKERKIDSLAQGFSFPFYVEYFIRVWDRTESGLHAKCAAIKNAVNQMNGAQVYETALPTTAKKLFFSTWPGWTGSSYRHRDLYAEDRYLADMLPFSSTFTAHLAEAEAIYDGTNGNLAGVRTFIGGTPQHSVLIGMTGAGKSYAMDDLLTQTQAGYSMLTSVGSSVSAGALAAGVATGFTPVKLVIGGIVAIWLILGSLVTPIVMQMLFCSGTPMSSAVGAAIQMGLGFAGAARLLPKASAAPDAAPSAGASGSSGASAPPNPPPVSPSSPALPWSPRAPLVESSSSLPLAPLPSASHGLMQTPRGSLAVGKMADSITPTQAQSFADKSGTPFTQAFSNGSVVTHQPAVSRVPPASTFIAPLTPNPILV